MAGQLVSDGTFDNVLSIIEKIVKVIEIVKKIIGLLFIVVVPTGGSLEGSLDNDSDDDFLIAISDAIKKGYVFNNVYSKSEIDDLLAQYSGTLSGFVSAAGGTYSAPFVFSSIQNQFIGSFATNLLAIDGDSITSIKKGSSNSSNNEKLTTQGYVDEQLTNYITSQTASQTYQPQSSMSNYLTTSSAASTYLAKTDAASTYEKKTDLATSVTTGSLTLNSKTVSDISTGGNSNNNKLATQGYVDYTTTGNIATALSSYLSNSSAASTYQTISGMSNYLTVADAASTYQPVGSYLTSNDISGKADLSGAVFTGDITTPNLNVSSDLFINNYVFKPIRLEFGFYYEYTNNNFQSSWVYTNGFIYGNLNDTIYINCAFIPKHNISQYSAQRIAIREVRVNNRAYYPTEIQTGFNSYPIDALWVNMDPPMRYPAYLYKTTINSSNYIAYMFYWVDGTTKRTNFDCSGSKKWSFSFNNIPFIKA